VREREREKERERESVCVSKRASGANVKRDSPLSQVQNTRMSTADATAHTISFRRCLLNPAGSLDAPRFDCKLVFQVERKQYQRLDNIKGGPFPENQGHILALTDLYVP